jgi:hypothetical protein
MGVACIVHEISLEISMWQTDMTSNQWNTIPILELCQLTMDLIYVAFIYSWLNTNNSIKQIGFSESNEYLMSLSKQSVLAG